MSFSSDIKIEITRQHINSKQEAAAMLYAVFASIGVMGLSAKGVQLKVSFESKVTARYICRLLDDFFKEKCGIAIASTNLNSKQMYQLSIDGKDEVFGLLEDLGFPKGSIFLSHTPEKSILNNTELIPFFVKGLFLSCGMCMHPKKNYHAEFIFSSGDFASYVCGILNFLSLNAKIVSRKSDYVVYLKGGDNISALLSVTGAFSALLELENIRAYKEIRNNVNRAANCETANFTKTYGSAQKYLKMIDLIEEAVGLSSLSDVLREAAEIRREYPEASLSELADIMGITKSALNHRLRKLKQISDTLQEEA